MPGFFFPDKVTKFASSFHYYVHYAVLRQKTIFLVNNNNDFAIPFTTFGLEKLHIFVSLLRSLQCEYDKNILFISPLRGLRCKNEKGSCFCSVLPLLLQHHDEETKFLFSFAMVTGKRNLVFITPLPWLRSWKEYSCFWFHYDIYYANNSLHLPITLIRY